MQRRITKISRFIDVNSSIDEDSRRFEIAPSNDAMERIISIQAARIYVGKIDFCKIGGAVRSYRMVANT